jgi:hypothetical protein
MLSSGSRSKIVLVRIAGVVISLMLLVNSGLARGQESRPATLLVTATVVSSCSVTSSPGQIAYRCTRAHGPVRVNGQSLVLLNAQGATASHTNVTGSLVTIDF